MEMTFSQSILNTLNPYEVNVGETHTIVNCNNLDDWIHEQLQLILHYPDQGDGEYAADPIYVKSMSYGLLIYVSGR